METVKKVWEIIKKGSVTVFKWVQSLLQTPVDTIIAVALIFLVGTYIFSAERIQLVGYSVILLFAIIASYKKNS